MIRDTNHVNKISAEPKISLVIPVYNSEQYLRHNFCQEE